MDNLSEKVRELFIKMDNDVTRISNLQLADENVIFVQTYLAKYLIIAISALYEEVVCCSIEDHTRKYIDIDPLYNYVISTIKGSSFQNLNPKKLIGLMQRFDENFANELDKMDNEKTALGNINYHRNGSAHRSGSDITLGDVVTYYNNSKPLIMRFSQFFFEYGLTKTTLASG